MIVEHAWLSVDEGREEEFMVSVVGALAIIEGAPQCHGAQVQRQVEDPRIFLLLVQWASVQAHMDFRESDQFVEWRARTAPFYASPAVVTHFSQPLERPRY